MSTRQNGRVRIDLHTHSTVSDGTDEPAELVAKAAGIGLDVVALTDHDTTAGWERAVRALPPGLRLVPGAELSCHSVDRNGRRVTVHLLAYLFDPASPALAAEQLRLRDERRARLRAMAKRMADDGLPVDADEVLARLPTDSPAGKPHLAQALVRAGTVGSVDEAFARYLGKGSPYWVPRHDTPVEDAIDLIAAAGGVTVLAHPFASQRGATVTPEAIADLAAHGLSGIEVDHPLHDRPTRDRLRVLAGDLGLLRTGSSDYHGTNKTIGLGDDTTDPAEFEALVARATGATVVTGKPAST